MRRKRLIDSCIECGKKRNKGGKKRDKEGEKVFFCGCGTARKLRKVGGKKGYI